MDEAVEDGVGDGGIADDFVPAVDGDLTGDDGGSSLISVLHDFEEIAPLIVAELFWSPVVQDEKIGPCEGFERSGVSAIAPCQGEGGEQPGGSMVGDGEVFPARLVAEGTGKPALADPGRTGEQQPVPFADPVAAGQLEEEAAIQTTDGAEVGVLNLGVVTKSGGTGSGLEAFLATQRHLAFEQQGEPLAMLQGAGFGLRFQVLEAFGHAVEAELAEHVVGGMGQHDRVSP